MVDRHSHRTGAAGDVQSGPCGAVQVLLPDAAAGGLVGGPVGSVGAILCASLTQLGLIGAVQWTGPHDLTVFELQVLMAVITMTGLILGLAIDERVRTATQLRQSLRMAAAGQMAAALAHELNQPLTALSSYAQACRALLTLDGGLTTETRDRLEDVSARIVRDAHRASDVVKRLRDFFRDGTTQLD